MRKDQEADVNSIQTIVKKGVGYIARMGVCVHTHTHAIWIYRLWWVKKLFLEG